MDTKVAEGFTDSKPMRLFSPASQPLPPRESTARSLGSEVVSGWRSIRVRSAPSAE
ncbi:MAG: hypothetical protein IPH30_11095 [Betaproteobacteria bacterium]|nr:hypothetical protein [Betaproteobacteria bacterium]